MSRMGAIWASSSLCRNGKERVLGVAAEAWEAAGYEGPGDAAGIAAENLESGSGIASRTIASMEP